MVTYYLYIPTKGDIMGDIQRPNKDYSHYTIQNIEKYSELELTTYKAIDFISFIKKCVKFKIKTYTLGKFLSRPFDDECNYLHMHTYYTCKRGDQSPKLIFMHPVWLKQDKFCEYKSFINMLIVNEQYTSGIYLIDYFVGTYTVYSNDKKDEYFNPDAIKNNHIVGVVGDELAVID